MSYELCLIFSPLFLSSVIKPSSEIQKLGPCFLLSGTHEEFAVVTVTVEKLIVATVTVVTVKIVTVTVVTVTVVKVVTVVTVGTVTIVTVKQ